MKAAPINLAPELVSKINEANALGIDVSKVCTEALSHAMWEKTKRNEHDEILQGIQAKIDAETDPRKKARLEQDYADEVNTQSVVMMGR